MQNKLQNKQAGSCLERLCLHLLVFAVFATILFALASYVSIPSIAGWYLNPDFNTTTYLAYNLIYEHGQLFAWHIGSAPSFVPEMALMYLVTLVSKNAFINLLVYVVFQLSCVMILIPAILKAATKSSAGLRLGIIFVFILLLTVLLKHDFNVYSRNGYFSTILAPGFHYGAALSVFASIFLFLKVLNNSKLYLKVCFFFLLVIAGLSDPLTYVYFTFPMIVTLSIFYFLRQLSAKEYLTYTAIVIIAFLTAYITYHLLPIHYLQIKLQPSFSPLLLLDFIKTVLFFIQKNFVWGILWVLFMVGAPYSIWQSYKKTEGRVSLVDYVILLQFITVIVSTPLIILAVNQIFPSFLQIYPTVHFWADPSHFFKQLDYLPYRYFINYFTGPVFLGYPLLVYKHYRGIIEKLNNNCIYAIILIAFGVTAFFLKAHHFHKNTLLHFQSGFTVCLDNYAKQYKLTNGISDSYAISNMVNAFSKQSLHLALISSSNFIQVNWQNTEQLYQYKKYNFAVTNTDTLKQSLIERYGKPSHTLTCMDNRNTTFFIYVYADNRMNTVFNP